MVAELVLGPVSVTPLSWGHLSRAAALGGSGGRCPAMGQRSLPAHLPRKVCCMLGPWIRDVLERLMRFVQPWGCCLLLLFHNDIVKDNLEYIKHDCLAPEVMVKVKKDPCGVFSVLLMMVEGLRRTGWILQVNNWF